ncbi:helix-turn-helix transcriptional regulator [Ornithinimicrobium cerasi]|uniref:Proteasome accessory factor C n=1 Tax=Ornithinimicrobium cerasi TaxID=2248773 RepID=A0A285VPA4_9MICO|nr:WYL domain-containing protein [Ornithinimicrobium cerasi]SOC54441.1 proteasome accessory factor C [Ornithinimicrobium cerasi]
MATYESATSRLGRLLTMVPWLLNRQGVDLASAARELGVSEAQVVDDLELLFVCGLPGHYPDDLIDAQWEDGRVYVSNADTIARPLRLGRDEALALIVALRALRDTPGLTEHDAIDRALAKLEAAAGDAAATAASVTVDLEQPLDPELSGRLRDGLVRQRRLHLRYTVASRDETTERDVDPIRVVGVDGRWYLEAWCHRAVGVRLFRLDRIEELTVLEEDGTPPADLPPRELGAGVYRAAPEDLEVTLHLEPSAAWVAETFPVERVDRREDGSLEVMLRVADPRWLQRLVWRAAGQVRVLAPAELVGAVARGAVEAVEGHTQANGLD